MGISYIRQKAKSEKVATEKENEAVVETLLKFKRDELIGLCRGHKLMVSGTKLELAKRLAEFK